MNVNRQLYQQNGKVFIMKLNSFTYLDMDKKSLIVECRESSIYLIRGSAGDNEPMTGKILSILMISLPHHLLTILLIKSLEKQIFDEQRLSIIRFEY